MGLEEYSWTREELDKTEYAGKYVTHDFVNKHRVIEQVENPENDLELGETTLQYEGESMSVRLEVTQNYAIFFYDEAFDQKLGEEDFKDVITHFLTPDKWKDFSSISKE